MLTVIVFIALLVASVNAFGGLLDKVPPETVPALDQTAYAGRWFQVYASIIPNMTFERNGYCVTADYTITSPLSFDIINSEAVGSPKGVVKQYKGTLDLLDPTEPGRWNLNGNWFAFYWVVAVGDIGSDGLYPWAVVTTPFSVDLFVLTRDVAVFNAKYKTFMLNYLATNGFDKRINKPHETYQGADCAYNW